jgi:hypothetical protein
LVFLFTKIPFGLILFGLTRSPVESYALRGL